jgi:hypothetical protein
VFTAWYRVLRRAVAASHDADKVDKVDKAGDLAEAYRAAAAMLDGAGMPGVQAGLLPLALLSLRLRADSGFDREAVADAVADAVRHLPPDADWGPYRPWVEPLLLLGAGRGREAAAALLSAPEPPADLMCEAMYALEAAAAIVLEDRTAARRVYEALLPADGELAGAGSGLISFGPVRGWLDALGAVL